MVSLKRMVHMAAALLIVLALAPLGVAFHEHDVATQAAGHADCDACHFRHLSGVETDGAPAPFVAGVAARGVVTARPGGERSAALGIRPTRGPPA